MKRYSSLIILISISVACFLLSNSSVAQDGTAGQAGEFLRYGVGGRALGMGRAFASVADDGSAMYWNPAGVAQLYRHELMFMHVNLFADDTHFDYAAWSGYFSETSFLSFFRSLGFQSGGLGGLFLSSGKYEERDIYNVKGSEFSNTEYSLLGNLSGSLDGQLFIGNYGLNLKWINQRFGPDDQRVESSGLGFDIGTVIQPINFKFWPFGFRSIKRKLPLRLGAKLNYLSGDYAEPEAPSSYSLGMSYAFRGNNFYFLPTIDYTSFLKYDRSEINVGSELRYNSGGGNWSLRLGFPVSGASGEQVLLGLGYERETLPLHVDLSFASHENGEFNSFGSNFVRFSLAWQFGKPRNVVSAAEIIEPFRLPDFEFKAVQDRATDEELASFRDFVETNSSYFLKALAQYPFNLYHTKNEYDNIARVFMLYYRYIKKNETLAKCYQDFIGGLGIVDREFEEYLKDYKGHSECGVPDRERLEAFKDEYEGERDELSSPENVGSFKNYLQVLLLLGENSKVENILSGVDSGVALSSGLSEVDKNLFMALATKSNVSRSSDSFKRVVESSTNIFEQLLAAISLAVLDDSEESIERVLAEYDYSARDHKNDYYVFPLFCDGILIDDALFAKAYLEARNLTDANEIAKAFLPVALEWPQTTMGRIASEIASGGDGMDSTRIDEIWEVYKELFKANGVIKLSSFENTLVP